MPLFSSTPSICSFSHGMQRPYATENHVRLDTDLMKFRRMLESHLPTAFVLPRNDNGYFRIPKMRNLLMAAMVVAVALTLRRAASAAIIIVNTTSDTSSSGDRLCSLREAINNANAESDATSGDCSAGTGNDAIHFVIRGTIMLGSTLPPIEHALVIDGTGQSITIDGARSRQVMVLDFGAAVNVNGLKVAHGSSITGGGIENDGGTLKVRAGTFVDNAASQGGGGIDNYQGKLTVTKSTFIGNNSPEFGGGGIYNYQGTVSVTRSRFSHNSTSSGLGGAIENFEGVLTLTKSTFMGNRAPDGGGGIDNFGKLTIADSAFSSNSAPSAFGGGIDNFDGALSVTNSTFSYNTAIGGGAIENGRALTVSQSTFSNNNAIAGGGIENDADGSLNVSNSTFFHNGYNYGGAIENDNGIVSVTNSTFLGNIALPGEGGGIQNHGLARLKSTIVATSIGGDCSRAIADAGYNIADDATCGFVKTGSANNGDGVNPLLSRAGLGTNGGPTETIALHEGSPAIDAIPFADCTDQASPPHRMNTDQRGMQRPDSVESDCDIGAYEFQNAFVGQSGRADCRRDSVSALAQGYGGMDSATSARHFPSVHVLDAAIRAFCGG